MKVAIISQARMTSTRLPGKVLKRVIDTPLINWHVKRLKAATNADKVLVATTTNKADTPLVEACKQLNVSVYRGSEHDVLDRFFQAANNIKADTIVRVTSDCPLIDPSIIDTCIQIHRQKSADYTSNVITRTFPRGLDVEVFSFAALKHAASNATSPAEREHVTPYIRHHPNLFSQAELVNPTPTVVCDGITRPLANMRWTVDTIDDFKLMEKLLTSVKDDPLCHWSKILKNIQANPAWLTLNEHVEQKHG